MNIGGEVVFRVVLPGVCPTWGETYTTYLIILLDQEALPESGLDSEVLLSKFAQDIQNANNQVGTREHTAEGENVAVLLRERLNVVPEVAFLPGAEAVEHAASGGLEGSLSQVQILRL